MRVKQQILLAVALASSVFLAGCATAIQTHEQRLEFVKKMGGRESIDKSLNCKTVTMDYQRSEDAGGEWYDWYVASGCGVKTDYVTKVSQQHVSDFEVTNWNANMAANESEFKDAAEEQLKRTATFDLGCKELEYTTLDALIEKNHSTFQSSIGASGCGKKTTYRSSCSLQGLKDGKHDIVCQSLATPAAAR